MRELAMALLAVRAIRLSGVLVRVRFNVKLLSSRHRIELTILLALASGYAYKSVENTAIRSMMFVVSLGLFAVATAEMFRASRNSVAVDD